MRAQLLWGSSLGLSSHPSSSDLLTSQLSNVARVGILNRTSAIELLDYHESVDWSAVPHSTIRGYPGPPDGTWHRCRASILNAKWYAAVLNRQQCHPPSRAQCHTGPSSSPSSQPSDAPNSMPSESPQSQGSQNQCRRSCHHAIPSRRPFESPSNFDWPGLQHSSKSTVVFVFGLFARVQTKKTPTIVVVAILPTEWKSKLAALRGSPVASPAVQPSSQPSTDPSTQPSSQLKGHSE